VLIIAVFLKNLMVSLMDYAAAAGIKCVVILPAGKVTPVQGVQPLVYGAKVIFLPTDFDGCMKVVEELVAKYGAYPANSLNPARIEGHQATVFQTAHFFGWEMPNWIALPVGNGSNCSSVGKGMRLMKELGLVANISRILGCQSSAANPLAESWEACAKFLPCHRDAFAMRWGEYYKPKKVGETTATAARIGDPVSAFKVMREIMSSGGVMTTAEEPALNQAVAECGKDGIFICPQTGTALAGVRNALARGYIKPGEMVVVVSTATGLKFTESAALHLQNQIVQLADCSAGGVAKILGL
jgi:threonine synthase